MRASRKREKYFLLQQNIHRKHQAKANEQCIGYAVPACIKE
jgi:hypothetical protein